MKFIHLQMLHSLQRGLKTSTKAQLNQTNVSCWSYRVWLLSLHRWLVLSSLKKQNKAVCLVVTLQAVQVVYYSYVYSGFLHKWASWVVVQAHLGIRVQRAACGYKSASLTFLQECLTGSCSHNVTNFARRSSHFNVLVLYSTFRLITLLAVGEHFNQRLARPYTITLSLQCCWVTTENYVM